VAAGCRVSLMVITLSSLPATLTHINVIDYLQTHR
jgi:hypothetical protein